MDQPLSPCQVAFQGCEKPIMFSQSEKSDPVMIREIKRMKRCANVDNFSAENIRDCLDAIDQKPEPEDSRDAESKKKISDLCLTHALVIIPA